MAIAADFRATHLARLLFSAAAIALATPLAAQAAPATDDAAGLSDIVVTASRSGAQSLQNVPVAVAVVNIDQITKSGQGNLVDIAKFTPSLSISEGGPGFNKFNMRGLSTGGYVTSDTSDRPLVAVYLDDTPISVQGQTPDLRIYDLDRVEVLRGPQGTLYGAGSMAGTVKFVTVKPNMTSFSGNVELGAKTTDHGEASYSAGGMINLPIVEGSLALRANFYTAHDGGFIDNIGKVNRSNANGNNTWQGRAALRWIPDPKLTIDLAFTYERSIADGLNTAFDGLKPYQLLTNGPEGTEDDFKLYTANVDYDLGFAHAVITGSYTDRRIGFDASVEPQIAYFFVDYNTGLPVSTTTYLLFTAPGSYSQAISLLLPAELYQIDQNLKDYMLEGRLVSKPGGPVAWTVGGFYEKQVRHLRQDIPTPGFDTLSYTNLFDGPKFDYNGDGILDGPYNSQLVDKAFQANDIFSGLQDTGERQIALYADGTWHATPKLDLTAGLRYFDFKESYYLFEAGIYGVIDHKPLTTFATLKSTGVNPRANISYHVSSDVMIYAEAAKGFRYGGANQPVPLGTSGVASQCASDMKAYGYSAAPLTFGPDRLWNYTIGEKAKLAGGRVTFNASAYYIDWSDVQTRLRLNCSYFFTDNKGKITSKGIELETSAKLTAELTLSAFASYNDSHANGDIPTVGAFNGDRTPYSPQWNTNVQAFYDRPLGNGALHLQAGYQFLSSQNTTFNNFTTTITGGKLVSTGPSQTFAVIPEQHNVSAAVNFDIDNVEVGIFGNNLTNGVGVVNVARATYYQLYQPGSRVTYARPRTIGVRAKLKF